MISLYIHIPFCKSKCSYCSFYSLVSKPDGYVDAVGRALEYWAPRVKTPVSSIYIGGGTPSILPPSQLAQLIENIRKNYSLSEVCEFTVECNPESVTEPFLSVAKAFGVNRISLGVQSFDDKVLSVAGRLHDSKTALSAIRMIRKAGFDNISCDIIYGLAYQSEQSVKNNLDILVNEGIPHISCYNLQVEEGTRLYSSTLKLPDEAQQEKMYYLVCSHLADNGYSHYEISNFAKRGYEARHNSGYWTGSDYLGIGPSAHSKIGDIRSGYDADIKKFLAKTDFSFDFSERITDRLFEKIMLSLRTSKGMPLELLKNSARYIDMLCKNGFAYIKNDNVVLTDKGFYLSNTIISDITAKEC